MRRSFELSLTQHADSLAAAPPDDDAILASTAPPIEHDGDEAAIATSDTATVSRFLHVDQMVLYSSTWKVPVLYIRAYARAVEGGAHISPLSLEELLESPLFLSTKGTSTPLTSLLESDDSKSDDGNDTASEGHHDGSNAETAAYFPPISMCSSPLGDDEGAGESWQLQLVPWLYLHPCQTAQMVGEMLAAAEDEEKSSEGKGKRQHETQDESNKEGKQGLRYLEAFLAICASAVEMRGGNDGMTP